MNLITFKNYAGEFLTEAFIENQSADQAMAFAGQWNAKVTTCANLIMEIDMNNGCTVFINQVKKYI